MEQRKFTPSAVLARNTILNLVGMVLPILIGVIAIPYAIKGLSTEGFGVFSIVWVIIGYFSLLDFGVSRATTKFIAEDLGNQESESLPQVFWTASGISLLFGLLGTILVSVLTPYLIDHILNISSEFVPQAKLSLYFSALALPIILVATSWKGVLGAAQRFDLVNLVFVPSNALCFAIPALSYPFDWNISTVILLILLVRILSSLSYLWLCKKVFPAIATRPSMDRCLVRKFASFGGWVMISSILGPVLVYMDRFFIGSILSISMVTYYIAPYEAVSRLRIFPVALMNTVFPEFSMLSNVDQSARAETLFIRSVKYILLLTSVISIMLFYYSHEILQLWLGVEFAEKASTVLRLFSIGIVLNSLAFVPFSYLQSIGRPDLPAKFHMFEFLFYIILLWFFTAKFGITGTAWAWLIRITIDTILLFYSSWRLYPGVIMEMGKHKIWHELGFLACFGVSAWIVESMDLIVFVEIFCLFILSCIFYGCIWFIVLDDLEKSTLTSFASNFFGRLHK